MLDFLKRLVTWWNGQTLGTQIFTARKGVKVGEDDQGNTFYRSRDGKRRWVIYNGESEASRVSPDWHGWLHHTWDEPPSDKPLAAQDVGKAASAEPDRDIAGLCPCRLHPPGGARGAARLRGVEPGISPRSARGNGPPWPSATTPSPRFSWARRS
jgi:NADH:ubiquinone oxidoreductase subunit